MTAKKNSKKARTPKTAAPVIDAAGRTYCTDQCLRTMPRKTR